MQSKIKVGVSSCLLGNYVRYNGGHKQNRYITDTLSSYFDFLPVCPEVECGLPVPREAMRLIGEHDNPRLVTIRNGEDLTSQMQDYSLRRVAELAEENLSGFIFKKDSPSSGLYRVKVYDVNGKSVKKGRGLFAAAMANHFSILPMEEEGRLQDARLRENFIERVFAYKRWQDFLQDEPDYKKLIAFHTGQKLLMMSHSPEKYKYLGRLVAEGKDHPHQQLMAQYEQAYMEALSVLTSVKKNRNVLYHIMGYFKAHLTADEKAELLEVIDDYANELAPLTVPLTLVNHYVRKYNVAYLQDQVYLKPHPSELMLRNHV